MFFGQYGLRPSLKVSLLLQGPKSLFDQSTNELYISHLLLLNIIDKKIICLRSKNMKNIVSKFNKQNGFERSENNIK